MAEKRYYWLKLKEGFFEQKEIKRLRRIAGGDTYTIIYLKMLLKSLKNDGFLYFEGIDDDFVSELALDIDEDEDNVKVTVNYLISKGILEAKTEDEFVLITAKEMTGSETKAAARKRKSRDNVTQERDNVTLLRDNFQKCHTEIEKEKEKELDKDKKIYNVVQSTTPHTDYHYKEIVDYLNDKTNQSYRHTTKNTQTLIKARTKEGFTVDDFKKVIDNKYADWKGTEWEQYLRPETLFGTKFESYLNANVKKKINTGCDPDDEHTLDGLF